MNIFHEMPFLQTCVAIGYLADFQADMFVWHLDVFVTCDSLTEKQREWMSEEFSERTVI